MAKRVLIADQDMQSRDALARNLAVWGYEVVLAADGAAAWAVLQRGDAPKIAIFDANLAGVDCLELSRRVRDLRGDDSFVLVLGSEDANEAKATHLAALEAGADGVLAKPVHMRALRMQLAAGMRGRRLAMSDRPSRSLSIHAAPLSTQDPADRALVGRIVARKYQIDRLLGKGGMGTVWQGTHLTLGIPVAIKFIKAEYARHELARARFELEARSAARVQTRYAVKILDYGVTEGGLPYLVMEYLDGPSLLQYVRENGPMSFAETLRLITQAAHALDQLHSSGTIHRDVKPDNILLVADPDAPSADRKAPRIAKLIDFGVAKVVAARETGDTGPGSLCTQHGIVIGTPNYMPPEQIAGDADAGIGSDLWALATCAFTAITGEIPFEGGTLGVVTRKVCKDPLPVPSHITSSVPVEFDAWFARACNRDPKQRFASAREAARALVDAYDDYASASVEMTPSLNQFVAKQATPSSLKAPAIDYGASTLPTVRPMRNRLFDLDAPTLSMA
jgi:serine/threonine-protein kinase